VENMRARSTQSVGRPNPVQYSTSSTSSTSTSNSTNSSTSTSSTNKNITTTNKNNQIAKSSLLAPPAPLQSDEHLWASGVALPGALDDAMWDNLLGDQLLGRQQNVSVLSAYNQTKPPMYGGPNFALLQPYNRSNMKPPSQPYGPPVLQSHNINKTLQQHGSNVAACFFNNEQQLPQMMPVLLKRDSVQLQLMTPLFGCYWRNRNNNLLGFPFILGKPSLDYVGYLDQIPRGPNTRAVGVSATDIKATKGDSLTILVRAPPELDPSNIRISVWLRSVADLGKSFQGMSPSLSHVL
jgi:hypothetical protein